MRSIMPKFEYIQAPNFQIDPATLALGSIFSELNKPTDLLNKYDIVPIPTDLIKRTRISKFSEQVTRSIKADGGLNANIAQGIGGSGDVIFTMSKSRKESYLCNQLDTESFDPSEEYVNQSLTALDVQEHLDACRFWDRKVFMVTGLKIAKDLQVSHSTSDERGGTLQVGIDATPMGIPAGVGAGASATPASSRSIMYEAPPLVVFALRVLRITPKGKVKAVTAGALYFDDVGDSPALEAEWDTEDIDISGLGGDVAVVQVVGAESS
ncbi:hypothetical protein BDR22DRAFT_850254 [Usnea florida]